MDKGRIRKEILAKLETQSLDDKARRSELIKQQVLSARQYKKSKFIFIYVSTALEVDTWSIIKETLKNRMKVCVPMITDYKRREMLASQINDISNLEKNKWGIHQPKTEDYLPVDRSSINLAIIPGVAFDTEGNRLGKGKGFFDGFLKDIRTIPIFGLAFTLQIINSLPITPFDVPVTRVVSA